MTLVAYSVPQIRFHKGKLKKTNCLFKILSLTTTVLFSQWIKEHVKGSLKRKSNKTDLSWIITGRQRYRNQWVNRPVWLWCLSHLNNRVTWSRVGLEKWLTHSPVLLMYPAVEQPKIEWWAWGILHSSYVFHCMITSTLFLLDKRCKFFFSLSPILTDYPNTSQGKEVTQ